jgi:hypothetical protein
MVIYTEKCFHNVSVHRGIFSTSLRIIEGLGEEYEEEKLKQDRKYILQAYRHFKMFIWEFQSVRGLVRFQDLNAASVKMAALWI